MEGSAADLAKQLLTRVESKIDSVREDVQALRVELAETRGQNLKQRIEDLEAAQAALQDKITRWTAYAVGASAVVSMIVSVMGWAR